MEQLKEVKKIYMGCVITIIGIACMLSFFVVSVVDLYKDDSIAMQAEDRVVEIEKMQNIYYQILLGKQNAREDFEKVLNGERIPEIEDGWNSYIYTENEGNTTNMDAARLRFSNLLKREVEKAQVNAARVKADEYLMFRKQLEEIGFVSLLILLSTGIAFFFIVQGTKKNYEAYKKLSDDAEQFYIQSNLLVKEFRSISGVIAITLGNLLKILDETRDKTREREVFLSSLFKELKERRGILNRGVLNDFRRRLIQFRRRLDSDFEIIIEDCEGIRRQSLEVQKRFRNFNWKVGYKNVF